MKRDKSCQSHVQSVGSEEAVKGKRVRPTRVCDLRETYLQGPIHQVGPARIDKSSNGNTNLVCRRKSLLHLHLRRQRLSSSFLPSCPRSLLLLLGLPARELFPVPAILGEEGLYRSRTESGMPVSTIHLRTAGKCPTYLYSKERLLFESFEKAPKDEVD